MADFTALKTAIQTYIKQNGNEEITGEKLQEILLSMVTTLGDSAINDLITALNDEVAARQNADGTLQQNITNEATARGNADTALGGRIDDEATARGNADTALSDRLGSTITAENTAADQIGAEAEARTDADSALQELIDGITNNIENGYVYAGIATPSSTPATGKVFYLALTAGTYTNFGSTVVSQGINILKYNGTAWSLDAFIGIDDTPTPNSQKLVKSGGVATQIALQDSKNEILFNNKVSSKSINLVDPSRARYSAAIQSTGVVDISYPNFAVSDYIPVKSGDTITTINAYSNPPSWYSFAVYGSDLSMIRVASGESYNCVEGDAYVRISFHTNDAQGENWEMMASLSGEQSYIPYNDLYEVYHEMDERFADSAADLSEFEISTQPRLAKVDSQLGFSVTKSTIQITNDYPGDYHKGQSLIVENGVDSAEAIFLFVQQYGGAWGNSTKVDIGGRLEIELPYDSPNFRIYHATYQATIKYTLILGGYIDAVKKIAEDSKENPYKNKKLVSLGDSYCAGGVWQNKMSQLTGMAFDPILNNNRYSVSATMTLSGSGECAQYRAKRIVEDGYVPNVIIVENVNDGNKVNNLGTPSDEPYFIGERQDLSLTGYTYDSILAYFQNNIVSILSGVTPSHGYRVGLPYETGNNASILSFDSLPTQNGQIAIRYGNQGTRIINVLSTDTVQDVISKITEFAWNRYDLFAQSNTIKFTPTLQEEYMPDNAVTITSNTCGMTITVSNNQAGSRYIVMTYPLHDITDWLDPIKWVSVDSISLYSAYKGLFNYLSANFPAAEIYLMFPLAYNVNVNSATYQFADGSLDTDKVLETIMFKSLKVAQKAICEYCKIPFWDLAEYACIYPQNVDRYFPTNDYHPNTLGYERWGIACAKFLE